MGLFLLIENKGVADYNSLMLFGASGNRYSTNPMTIGTFGSGSKMAVGCLLRAGINLEVYCGLTKLEYYSKPKRIKQASGRENMQQQVCCHISGSLPEGDDGTKGHKDLGFTLDYGCNDWPRSNGVALACREFVSNAIDGQIEMTEDFNGVRVEIVDESKCRAKSGFTRVLLPLTEQVQQFFNNLGKWFLHFSEPDVVRNGIHVLEKAGRSFDPDCNVALIYRRGVFVRKWTASKTASLFDYNIDVALNEARTFNDWEAKRDCAVALRNADRSVLARIFSAMQKSEAVWELSLDEYGLIPSSWEDEKAEVKEKREQEWQAAAALVLGDNGVLCDDVKVVSQMVEKKGYTPVAVKNKAWIDAAKANGIKTDEAILTKDDKVGRTFLPATDAVTLAVEIVWSAMMDLGFTHGKGKPLVGTFDEPINAECRAMGLYRPEVGTVYAHREYAENLDEQLVYIMCEECIHHSSGATDYSRDFQTMQTQIIGRLIWNAYKARQ
jgi:hypothetical protein